MNKIMGPSLTVLLSTSTRLLLFFKFYSGLHATHFDTKGRGNHLKPKSCHLILLLKTFNDLLQNVKTQLLHCLPGPYPLFQVHSVLYFLNLLLFSISPSSILNIFIHVMFFCSNELSLSSLHNCIYLFKIVFQLLVF